MWAQLALWKAIHAAEPGDPTFTLARVWRVAPETPVERVVHAVGELVLRHESLRTTYRAGEDGRPLQRVRREVAVPVEIVDHPEDGPTQGHAEAIRAESAARPFDIAADVPIRARLLVHAGAVRFAVITFSHLAVDGWSLELLRREFAELVAAPAHGAAEERPQPYERMLFERSQAGQRVQHRTLDYWRRQVAAAPRVMLEPLPGISPETVELWALESAAAARAIRTIARRERVSASAVLLAALTRVLGEAAGTGDCFLRVITITRSRPGTRNLVGAFNQEAALYVPAGGATFADHLRICARAAMHAYLHSECDCDALGDVVAEELARRGIRPGGYCFFNDIRFAEQHTMDDFGPDPDPPARPALGGTDVYQMPAKVEAGAMLFATFVELAELATVTLGKDRRFLPDRGARDVLLAAERLLVEASEGDVALS